MKPICPRIGHLVRPRPDFKGAGTGKGLIVDSRGIEVMVLQSHDGEMIWVRRDQLVASSDDMESEGRSEQDECC